MFGSNEVPLAVICASQADGNHGMRGLFLNWCQPGAPSTYQGHAKLKAHAKAAQARVQEGSPLYCLEDSDAWLSPLQSSPVPATTSLGTQAGDPANIVRCSGKMLRSSHNWGLLDAQIAWRLYWLLTATVAG